MSVVNGFIASSASSFGQSCSTTSPYYIQCDGDTIRLSTQRTPTTSSATGNIGEWCADSNYIYICVGSNTWKRVSLSSF